MRLKMNTTDQSLHADKPKGHRLFEKTASFCRKVIELYLMILKAWGHFFLIFMGVVLSVIAITEFNQNQTVLTSAVQIGIGAMLIFSQKTRELIWCSEIHPSTTSKAMLIQQALNWIMTAETPTRQIHFTCVSEQARQF